MTTSRDSGTERKVTLAVRRHRWKRIGLLLALVCGGAIAVGCWQMRAHDLLASATRVLEVPRRTGNITTAQFVDANRVLVLRRQTRATGANVVEDVTASLTNISNKQVTPLPVLGKQLSSQFNGLGLLSPDGRWWLWPEDDMQHWTACTLDGTRVKHWRSKTGLGFAWLPDSSGWVFVTPKESVSEEETTTSAPAPAAPPAPVTAAFTAGASMLPTPTPSECKIFSLAAEESRGADVRFYQFAGILGITSRDELLQLPRIQSLAGSGTIDGDLQPISKARGTPSTWSARLPALYNGILQYAYSPRSEQVAFLLTITRNDPMSRLMRRLFPPRKRVAGRDLQQQVWVVDSRGHRLRCLGTVDGDGIQCLSWTPDGQRVSFLYRGALYTVPVL